MTKKETSPLKLDLTAISDAKELMNSPMTQGMAQNQMKEMRKFALSELASGRHVVLTNLGQHVCDLETEDQIIKLFNTQT